MELVECGRVKRPRGLAGDLIVDWNNGKCPLDVGGELFLSSDKKDAHNVFKITALHAQGRFSVVRLENVADRTAAEKLKGLKIFIRTSSLRALGENEYYSFQILGLRVETEGGRDVGRIVKIFTAGANDVYEVLPDGAKRGEEILIPAIDSVIVSVDTKGGKIIIRPVDGLLD